MPINISRANISTPEGDFHPARFVFHDGKAAVWVEDKRAKTAQRVAFVQGAEFVRGKTAKIPMEVRAGDVVWTITQVAGGCGCGSPTKRMSYQQLLDPAVDHWG